MRFVETVQVQVKIYCYKILQEDTSNLLLVVAKYVLAKKAATLQNQTSVSQLFLLISVKPTPYGPLKRHFFAWKNYGLSFALRPFFLLKAASYREPELELESSFR